MSEPTCVAPMLQARQSPARCQCRECLRETIAVLEAQLDVCRYRVMELLVSKLPEDGEREVSELKSDNVKLKSNLEVCREQRLGLFRRCRALRRRIIELDLQNGLPVPIELE